MRRRNLEKRAKHSREKMDRKSRKPREKKKGSKAILFCFFLVMVGIGGGIFYKIRYAPTKERADLQQYYGVENEEDLAVVIDHQVIKQETGNSAKIGKIIDGEFYLEYSIVREYINQRFYWDPKEEVLLYTLPESTVSVAPGSNTYMEATEEQSKEFVILEQEDDCAYIALPFVQEYTNMAYQTDTDPNRVTITCQWGEQQTAVLRKDSAVRYQGGVKSPILTEVERSDKVTVLEDEDGWQKVATSDGFIGYIQTSHLKEIKNEIIEREFTEPEYTNIRVDKTINLVWDNVESEAANATLGERMANAKALTVVAPTWLSLADTEGNLTSIASAEYVTQAHNAGVDVWVTLRDFHGGTNSYEETYETLSCTSKRKKLIEQIVAKLQETGADGLNLDFELVSEECAEHYLQFIRELSVECRKNQLVFSTDNYVPMSFNSYYDLSEQGKIADYVIIMAYDEHTADSEEAGSVASYEYVEEGLKSALEDVSAEKLIGALPFYTRLWTESSEGLTSQAMSLDEARSLLAENGVEAQWDETTRQNYAQWSVNDTVYEIWLEDAESLTEKLHVIREENLAGVAAWNLNWGNSEVWDVISQYVEQ